MRLSRKSKKVNNKRKSSSINNMARRKSRTYRKSVSRGARRVFSRRTGSGIMNWFREGSKGVGGGVIAETIAVKAGAPQYGTIAGYGGAYLAGKSKGLIGKIIFDVLTKQTLPFGLGGNTQQQGGLSL